MKKNNFLRLCLFTIFLFMQNANAMELTKEALFCFEKVQVPKKLSYLNGKFKLQLIDNPYESTECPHIIKNLEQNTPNCLCLLYRLKQNSIWKNQNDTCHILITLKKTETQLLEFNIKNLCAQYYCADKNYFHWCHSGTHFITDNYNISIEKCIVDFVASSLCFMIGVFQMYISNDANFINRFVDFEKKAIKPFVFLECGHLSEYKPQQEVLICPKCQREVLCGIGSLPIAINAVDSVLELIQSNKVPSPDNYQGICF